MSIGIDPIIERLSVLKQRLSNASKDDVRRIAGVDLYHLPDPRVKQAFEKRIRYYETLSQNRSFLALEDAAKDAAMKLARIALLLSEKLTPEVAKRFSDWFYPPKHFNMWEDDATLKEKLQHYLKSKSFFTIRDLGKDAMLATHPYEEGIYNNCNNILEQHMQLYRHCQSFGKTSRELGTEVEKKKYSEAFHELSQLIDELELHLIQEPRKLHLGNFEEIQLAAAAFDHNVLGRFTKGFQSARGDNGDMKTEDIRRAGIDVCEELALEIAMQPPLQVSASTEIPKKEPIEDHGLKIWPTRQDVECADLKVTLTGKSWRIVEQCIANDGWAIDCGTRSKMDIDSDVKDLNAPWNDTGWKIAKHRDRKIILGEARKRKHSSQNAPETSLKNPRKSPVIAS